MGHSTFDPATNVKGAWNAGRVVGAKRALKPPQVWAIRFWLDHEGRLGDRALFDLAIDGKLRGCAVVKVKIGDLVAGGRIRARAIVVQRKTKRPVQFELMEAARTSLLAWLERRGGTVDDHAFASRIDRSTHLGTRQYARLVDEWGTAIGLRKEEYGTHSLRRTKAPILYRATGNLRAVQILLGHTKIESTVRYLGVDVEDALTLAEGTKVQDLLGSQHLNAGRPLTSPVCDSSDSHVGSRADEPLSGVHSRCIDRLERVVSRRLQYGIDDVPFHTRTRLSS